jgi:hypothetical protein
MRNKLAPQARSSLGAGGRLRYALGVATVSVVALVGCEASPDSTASPMKGEDAGGVLCGLIATAGHSIVCVRGGRTSLQTWSDGRLDR